MLTREELLGLDDIAVKEIKLPESIMGWGGKTVFIKQLTRGQQDTYLKRQYGGTRMKQDRKAREQEISAVDIYGHDAWLCVCGMCDETGKPIFQQKDIENLDKKNGEAIGFIAKEIVKFSGMAGDVEEADALKNSPIALIESSSTD